MTLYLTHHFVDGVGLGQLVIRMWTSIVDELLAEVQKLSAAVIPHVPGVLLSTKVIEDGGYDLASEDRLEEVRHIDSRAGLVLRDFARGPPWALAPWVLARTLSLTGVVVVDGFDNDFHLLPVRDVCHHRMRTLTLDRRAACTTADARSTATSES